VGDHAIATMTVKNNGSWSNGFHENSVGLA